MVLVSPKDLMWSLVQGSRTWPFHLGAWVRGRSTWEAVGVFAGNGSHSRLFRQLANVTDKDCRTHTSKLSRDNCEDGEGSVCLGLYPDGDQT